MLAFIIDIFAWRDVVKGLVEYIQFNISSVILTISLLESMPQYVIISVIILCFLIVIGLLILFFYYIYRKFNSIDNHINKKYGDENHNKDNSNTYKKDKKEYKKNVCELEAKILPDGQTAVEIIDKVIEFKKKK